MVILSSHASVGDLTFLVELGGYPARAHACSERRGLVDVAV